MTLWGSFLSFFTSTWLVSDREYASMPPVFHIDDYDTCMLYGKNALFCGIGFRLSPRNPGNSSQVWKIIEKLTASKKYYDHDLLRHGVCITKSCPNIEISKYQINNISMDCGEFIRNLENCYSSKFENMDLRGNIEFIRCETSESPYNFNDFDLLFCEFLVAFIALVLFAWVYDVFWQPNLQNKNTLFAKYISSFSISRNWKRLTKIDLEDPDTKALSNIQGVRLFNLAGVICSHTGTFNISLPLHNPRYIEALMDRKFEQFIGMGGRHTTLQSFFLMSSFLQTYKFFVDNEGKKKVSFFYMVRSFFSRYFRLTPMVALVTIFVTTLMPHFSRGPIWDYVVGDEYRTCRNRWWYNIVYLNNFLPLDQMCLPHVWSLSVDLQFYILGSLILWSMWNFKKRIVLIIASVWMYHVTQTFFSFYKKVSFAPISPELSYNTTLVNLRDFLILYKATTTNMAGFIAGIVFGYLFYQYRRKQLFTKNIYVTLWWLLSWGAMIFTVTFPGFFVNLGVENNNLVFALYMAFSRSVFAFGVGLFIFGMTQGQGHIIRAFCEWPPVYVLGRLNFNAYLVHVVLQRFMAGLKRSPNYVSDSLIVFQSLSYLALSYMAAVLLALFFEYPFVEINKHVTNEMRKRNFILSNVKDKKTE